MLFKSSSVNCWGKGYEGKIECYSNSGIQKFIRSGTSKMRGKIDSNHALSAPTIGLDQNESSSLEESSKETEFTHPLPSSECRTNWDIWIGVKWGSEYRNYCWLGCIKESGSGLKFKFYFSPFSLQPRFPGHVQKEWNMTWYQMCV